jgi:hypothetical protein
LRSALMKRLKPVSRVPDWVVRRPAEPGRGNVAQRQLVPWTTAVKRNLLILGLVLALTVGVSCTSGEFPLESRVENLPTDDGGSTPTDTTGTVPVDTAGPVPTDTASTAPTDTSAAVPTDTTGAPTDTTGITLSGMNLLACEPQRYAADMRVIGPAGGQLMVGNHKLTIMPDALSKEVAIVMEQIEGTVNSVRLSPEGLQFAIPAILSLSYKNCPTATWHYRRIVYTDEALSILEVMPSLDFNRAAQVKGLIYHFSRYAVAY